MPAAITCTATGVIDFPDFVTAIGTNVILKADGSLICDEDTTGNLRWVINTAPTNYEVRMGGAGSWLDFTVDRPLDGGALVELRDKYTLVVVRSVTI